jgi:hypothetical protein
MADVLEVQLQDAAHQRGPLDLDGGRAGGRALGRVGAGERHARLVLQVQQDAPLADVALDEFRRRLGRGTHRRLAARPTPRQHGQERPREEGTSHG